MAASKGCGVGVGGIMVIIKQSYNVITMLIVSEAVCGAAGE